MVGTNEKWVLPKIGGGQESSLRKWHLSLNLIPKGKWEGAPEGAVQAERKQATPPV